MTELSSTQQEDLRKRFEEAKKHIGSSEIKYVLSKFEEKYEGMKQVGNDEEVAETLNNARILYNKLKSCDPTTPDHNENWDHIASITAALLYFLNPWDLIPDYIPHQGLIDDAFVIQLALSCLDKDATSENFR